MHEKSGRVFATALSLAFVFLLSSCRLSNAIDGSLGSIIPDPPPPLQPKAALVATDGVARNINAFHMTLSLNFSDVTLTPANFKLTNGATMSGFTKVTDSSYAFTVTAAQEGTMNLSLLLAYTSKDNLSLNPPTVMLNYDITPPVTPSFISLTNSVTPSANRQPYIRISPTSLGDSIYVYTDSACTPTNKIGLNTAFTTYADVKTDLLPIDGHYTLYAQAVDPAGNRSGCSPTFIAYDLTTGLSGVPLLTFASPATTSTTVPVNLNWIDGKEVAFYSNATCDGPAAWEPFVSSKIRVIGPTDGVYPVSALMKSVRDGSTVCKTTSIQLDRTSPLPPDNITFGVVYTTFTQTPILTYSGGQDTAGGSGVTGYQIQLVKYASNGSIDSTSGWVTANPSGQSTAMSLASQSTYKVSIRTVDAAGNVSQPYTTNDSFATPPTPNIDSTHCPPNFIPVPAETDSLEPPEILAVPPFCVAKYEISCPGAYSTAGGDIVPGACSISSAGPFQGQFPAARYAQAACQGMGYDLISNIQWQVLGSAIDHEPTNWGGGFTNSGDLNLGVALDSPVISSTEWIPETPPTSASADDNVSCLTDPKSGVSGFQCPILNWNARKRVHRLINGYYIWDLTGVNSEWVSGSLADYFALVPQDTGNLFRDSGPAANFVSNQGPYGDRRMLSAKSLGNQNDPDNGMGVLLIVCDSHADPADCSILKGGSSMPAYQGKYLSGGLYSTLLYPTYHGASAAALAAWRIVGTARCAAPYTP